MKLVEAIICAEFVWYPLKGHSNMYNFAVLITITNLLQLTSATLCKDQFANNIYLVLGDTGLLTNNNFSESSQCRIKIVTCSSCIVVVKMNNFKISDDSCHVTLVENKNLFCYSYSELDNETFRSKTRYLNLILSESQNFSITYTAERNRQYLKGCPGIENVTFGGILSSPYFPSFYPRDLQLEYVISCTPSDALCRIKLIFTDFLVSDESVLQFYDWNGRKIRVKYGVIQRPRIIITSGPSLLIRFFANGATGLGFKAEYSFISGTIDENELVPYSDCGGEVDNVGGGITMMNMAQNEEKKYDCIWLIKPYNTYLANKLKLFASVVTFEKFPNDANLKIFEGQTSEGRLLEKLNKESTTGIQHVVAGTSGFYISLQATFNQSSHLAISYAVFSFNVCYAGPEFLCKNRRCVSKQLYCDGLNHCGDESDEPNFCSQGSLQPIDRAWYGHIPNYYFPKVDRYIDIKMATFIFTISSIGLVFVVGALVILLYRLGIRARHDRERQNRLQSISDIFGSDVVEVEVQDDDPPNYEPPPSYDEVMQKKLYKMEIHQCKCLSKKKGKKVPESPPPAYTSKISGVKGVTGSKGENYDYRKDSWTTFSGDEAGPSSALDPSVERRPLCDLQIWWKLLPKSMIRSNSSCECHGTCNCPRRLIENRKAHIAATWSPGTTKLESMDLVLNQVQARMQAQCLRNSQKIKKRCNLKGSTSVDNLFTPD